MRKLRVAVIGLGPGAEPHARSLLDLQDRIEVVAAVSRSEERARAFEAKFSLPVSTDLAGVIADRSIDAVLVLTPPNAHLSVAEQCLGAGKHVLVEKPLEVSVAQGEKLVSVARSTGRILGVVLQHRFRQGAERLHKIILLGEIGPVISGSMQVSWWRPQTYYDEPGRGTYARDGGGVLITQAIHTLDLFRSLVGVRSVEAAQVSTTALHRMESEDHVNALVRLGNGAPGSILATTASYPGTPERIDIIGIKGNASLAGGVLSVNWLDGRNETIDSGGGTGSGANIMDFPHDAHRAVITDFADAIRDNRPPRVTGEEALESQRLIEAILKAGGKAR